MASLDVSFPDPVETDGVKNTTASIANWTLKTLLPRLNTVIRNQREIIQELREEAPVRDGTPGSGDFAEVGDEADLGDGSTADPEEVFATNGTPDPQAPSEGDNPTSDELAELGELLQDLDSRAAQNIGDNGLADPDALREISDEELREISYVGDVAIEKIRNVFPQEGDE